MNRTRPHQSSNRTSTNQNSLDFHLILRNRDWNGYFSYINQLDASEQLNQLQFTLIVYSKHREMSFEEGHVAFIFHIIRKFVEVVSTFNDQSIVPARYISTLLHRGGSLLKNLKVGVKTTIRASDVVILLNALTGCRALGSQQIANSLSGLGYLAAVNGLSGQVEAQAIQELLAALYGRENNDFPAISSSLSGLGYLAAADGLSGQLEAQAIQTLLAKLHKLPDIDPLAISDSLYGVGQLAAASGLAAHLEARAIQALLEKLYGRQDIDSLAIWNSLYGVGKLAAADGLSEQLEAQAIQALLEKLYGLRDITFKAISSSLYGVGKLAAAGGLSSRLKAQAIQALLEKLYGRRDITSQAISSSLYGVGKLAAARGLTGQLEAPAIQALLDALVRCRDVSFQHIVSSLYGVAMLVTSKRVRGQRLNVRNVKFIVIDKLAEASGEESSQLAQAFVFLGEEMPKELLDKLKQQKPRPSPRQQVLIQSLGQKYGGTIKNLGAEILIGAWFVDLYLESGDRKIVIELDGSQHYDGNNELRIKDKRRDAYLASIGYEIIRLNVDCLTSAEYLLQEIVQKLKINVEEKSSQSPDSLNSQGLFLPKRRRLEENSDITDESLTQQQRNTPS